MATSQVHSASGAENKTSGGGMFEEGSRCSAAIGAAIAVTGHKSTETKSTDSAGTKVPKSK